MFCKITFDSDDRDAICMRRQQYPLKLAFSITINKSQGQTINTVGIYLDSTLFLHGQLYTAMSRVKNNSSLKFLIDKNIFNENEKNLINNIVYKEVIKN